jgi:hypothetical protein
VVCNANFSFTKGFWGNQKPVFCEERRETMAFLEELNILMIKEEGNSK